MAKLRGSTRNELEVMILNQINGGPSMFGTERFAEIYEDFEDNQDRLAQLFRTMTRCEFFVFVEFCLSQIDRAFEASGRVECGRVKGLLFAIAQKQLQVSYFESNATPAQRAAMHKTATACYELAKGFYPASEQPAVEAVWLASLNHGERFGYRSGPDFEPIPQHRSSCDPTS
jgi:hypothetical protein